MSIGRKPQSTAPVKYNSLRVTQSVLGTVIPVVFGQGRLAGRLIYYNDFEAHTQKNNVGKGLGGHAQTSYSYTATIQELLCMGPIKGVPSVWDTKGKFAAIQVTESFDIPVGGGSYEVTNSSVFMFDNGVASEDPYNVTVNDYGSPGSINYTGTYYTPYEEVGSSPAAGQYSQSNGTYEFSAADAGKTVLITYTYDLYHIQTTELGVIPVSDVIQVQNKASFYADLGVKFYPSGDGLSVGSGPGQYTVSNGTYTFNAADVGKTVIISYSYKDTSADTDKSFQRQLNATVIVGTQGQSAWPYLSSAHPEAALFGYTQVALFCVAPMNLGSAGEVPNYNFEIAGLKQWGGGIIDAHPVDCITEMLTNAAFGVGIDASYLDNWKLDNHSAWNYWAAAGFFISPVLDQQESVGQIIAGWLEAGNVELIFSEGKFKLKPYGDTTQISNGYVYNPDTTPRVDFNDDDYLKSTPDATDDPVQVSRKDWQDAYNQVAVEYLPRINSYNPDIVREQDDAAVGRFGLRVEDPQAWHFITTLTAAQFAANIRVKRLSHIWNEYVFTVGWNYCYLEPMDLVTLIDSNLGYDKLPVRIKKIVDKKNGDLEITAEDFPWGTATATQYPKQDSIPFVPIASQADPGYTLATVFAATNRLSKQSGDTMYIFASGQSKYWGGCDVWISGNGVDYDFLTKIDTPGRVGKLVNALPASASDPDVTNVLRVLMETDQSLTSVTQQQADQLTTLSAIVESVENGGLITRNEGFELGDAYWMTPAVGTFSIQNNPTNAHSGNKYAYIQVQTSPATALLYPALDFGNQIPLKIDLAFNEVIYASVWAYCELGQYSGVSIRVEQYDASDTLLHTDDSFALSGTGVWEKLYGSFTGVLNVAYCKISCRVFTNTGSTDVRFDDVYIAFGGPPADLITNGDGEIGDSGTIALGWTLGGGNPVRAESAVKRSGALALSIDNTGGAIDSRSYQEFSALEGHSYKISGYIKTSALPSSDAGWGAVINVDGNPLDLSYATFDTVSAIGSTPFGDVVSDPAIAAADRGIKADDQAHDWTYVEAVIMCNHSGLIRIYVQLGYGGAQSGQAWFDDCHVYDVTAQHSVEFIAYETAELVAQRTYDLSYLRRGVYESEATDHSQNALFARLDQASFIYKFDPTQYGQTLYLKFTSFNSFGNREQSLADVPELALTVPTNNRGSVASIDATYLPGMDKVPDGDIRKGMTAAHASYRPTSNPLTAHDAGSNVTINVAAFIMRCPAAPSDMSLGAGSITALAYSTLYYVYFDDADFSSGTPIYQATTSKADALNGAYRFFVGSILTPAAGALDTVGNNDGGAGAQLGKTVTMTPTIRVTTNDPASGPGAFAVENLFGPSVDGNPNTLQTDSVGSGTTVAWQSIGGFPAFSVRWQSLKLKIRVSAVTTGAGFASLDYNLTGHSADWVNVFTLNTPGSHVLQTHEITLPVSQNPQTVWVSPGVTCSGTGSASISYDILIEGQE